MRAGVDENFGIVMLPVAEDAYLRRECHLFRIVRGASCLPLRLSPYGCLPYLLEECAAASECRGRPSRPRCSRNRPLRSCVPLRARPRLPSLSAASSPVRGLTTHPVLECLFDNHGDSMIRTSGLKAMCSPRMMIIRLMALFQDA